MTALPASCERAFLERFLRAEAMALRTVSAAQAEAPPHALAFLKRHEAEEEEHLRRFEEITGIRSRERAAPPSMPRQWHACAVHLLGYEALGLEFARLLADLRPDLASIVADEETHVAFFEGEIRKILASGRGPSNGAREYARAWWRRLPRTLDRYLRDETLDPHREALRDRILRGIEDRMVALDLLP